MRDALQIKESQGIKIIIHFFKYKADTLSNLGAIETLSRFFARRSSSLVTGSCSTGPGGRYVAQDVSSSSACWSNDAGGNGGKKASAKAVAFSRSVDAVPLAVSKSSTPWSPKGRVALR